MKKLLLSSLILLSGTLLHSIERLEHFKRTGTGLAKHPYALKNTDRTPIRTQGQKDALISTASYVENDFETVVFTATEIALATSTLNVSWDGTEFSGADLDLVPGLLADKGVLKDKAIELTTLVLVYEKTRDTRPAFATPMNNLIKKLNNQLNWIEKQFLALP